MIMNERLDVTFDTLTGVLTPSTGAAERRRRRDARPLHTGTYHPLLFSIFSSQLSAPLRLFPVWVDTMTIAGRIISRSCVIGYICGKTIEKKERENCNG
ncbi:hypothetical protein KQX54_002810 [Cotesia glomerata]|uniref:Uncharacterized protein n=1 Tax=Cotesia glomerata TaxID=32391 RepID=A0AAV7I6J5_COTGL|nr:hypothetical protein KQX54_002810 [Cotesia glomerata]